MSELVSKVVDDTEICIRCILTPLFFSERKKKLRREAFLPPAGRRDVSLLRLRYTDLTRCKHHAKSLRIKENSYSGLASIMKADVADAYNDESVIGRETFSVDVVYSPMSEDGNYMSTEVDVYSDDKGLPMHADLMYASEAAPNEIQTQMRKFANVLKGKARFQEDEDPDNPEWTGGDFYR